MTRLLNILCHPLRVFNIWLDSEPSDPLVANYLADEARLRKSRSSHAALAA